MRTIALALVLAAGMLAACHSTPDISKCEIPELAPRAASWGFSWEPPTIENGRTTAIAAVRAGPGDCWASGATPGIKLEPVSAPGPFPYSSLAFTRNVCDAGCLHGCFISGTFPPDLTPGTWTFHGVMFCEVAGFGVVTYDNDSDLVVTLP